MSDDDRSWDGLGAGFECGEDLWAAGGGEDTSHIHPADTLDRRVQPFVRYTGTTAAFRSASAT